MTAEPIAPDEVDKPLRAGNTGGRAAVLDGDLVDGAGTRRVCCAVP